MRDESKIHMQQLFNKLEQEPFRMQRVRLWEMLRYLPKEERKVAEEVYDNAE